MPVLCQERKDLRRDNLKMYQSNILKILSRQIRCDRKVQALDSDAEFPEIHVNTYVYCMPGFGF